MPANKDFRVEILIAGTPVPEYERNGQYYVECNLNTPYTYKEKASECVNGEREEQEYPVTPYQIRITALSGKEFPNYFRVKVDGIKVKGLSLQAGESRQIKGFRDGTSVRELLFSMPRFAQDTDDRVTVERRPLIGTIDVECWLAALQTRKTEMRVNSLKFQQANKKDSNYVTQGQYMMATSRVGKVVCERSFARTVDSWKLMSMISTLTIQYRMAESLSEMGFNLRPPKFHIATSYDSRQKLIIRRLVKDEPDEPDFYRMKKRKEHRERPKKHEAAVAKALLDLQQSGTDPKPGPSNEAGDDEIEIVRVCKSKNSDMKIRAFVREPVLVDLTDKDDDVVMVTGAVKQEEEGTNVNSVSEKVKGKGKRAAENDTVGGDSLSGKAGGKRARTGPVEGCKEVREQVSTTKETTDNAPIDSSPTPVDSQTAKRREESSLMENDGQEPKEAQESSQVENEGQEAKEGDESSLAENVRQETKEGEEPNLTENDGQEPKEGEESSQVENDRQEPKEGEESSQVENDRQEPKEGKEPSLATSTEGRDSQEKNVCIGSTAEQVADSTKTQISAEENL